MLDTEQNQSREWVVGMWPIWPTDPIVCSGQNVSTCLHLYALQFSLLANLYTYKCKFTTSILPTSSTTPSQNSRHVSRRIGSTGRSRITNVVDLTSGIYRPTEYRPTPGRFQWGSV